MYTDMTADVAGSRRGSPLSALVFRSVYAGGNPQGQKYETFAPRRRVWVMGERSLEKSVGQGGLIPKTCCVVTALDSKSEKVQPTAALAIFFYRRFPCGMAL